jgi:hypothetical protein
MNHESHNHESHNHESHNHESHKKILMSLITLIIMS